MSAADSNRQGESIARHNAQVHADWANRALEHRAGIDRPAVSAFAAINAARAQGVTDPDELRAIARAARKGMKS